MKTNRSFTHFGLLVFFFVIATYQAHAEGQHDVPRNLFGLELGGIYDIGDPDNNNTGNMPVKKVCSVYQIFGHGFHYNFQPINEYPHFDYKEKKEGNSTRSSFSAYILPIIPDNIYTSEQLKNQTIQYEIAAISWTNENLNSEESYYWATEMCKVFISDIKINPEIYDEYENNIYQCSFNDKDRTFIISSVLKSIRLEYINDIQYKKNNEIDEKLTKILAEKIRPYK